MTDTTLPPEVAEAIDSIDDCMRMDIKVVPVGPLKVVRDYCDRLAEENARLRPMLTARSQEMLRLVSESGELKTRAEKAEARVQELQDALRDDSARIVREWDDERAVWKQRAERAESEVAAIKKRIAETATATLRITYEEDRAMGVYLRDMDIGMLCLLDGECVRLLPLDEKS